MHTEDDTFKVLKRIPFCEVRMHVRKLKRLGFSTQLIRSFIEKVGWEVDEYHEKLRETLDNEDKHKFT